MPYDFDWGPPEIVLNINGQYKGFTNSGKAMLYAQDELNIPIIWRISYKMWYGWYEEKCVASISLW